MLDIIHVVQAATLPEIHSTNLGIFIRDIYRFAIGFVGLAVFVQFLSAGFSYFMSAGNVAEAGNAKGKMQNAVLGAILLLSSYLILNIINPDFTNLSFAVPTLPPPPTVSPKPVLWCDPKICTTGHEEAVKRQEDLQEAGIHTTQILNTTSMAKSNASYLVNIAKSSSGTGTILKTYTVIRDSDVDGILPKGNQVIMNVDDALHQKILSFGADSTKIELDGVKRTTFTDKDNGVVYVLNPDYTIKNQQNVWNIYFPEKGAGNE